MILLKNLKIYIMEENCQKEKNIIEKGYILTDGEKIKCVGKMEDMPSFVEIEREIDLTGMTAVPGFIDSHCHIGMWEDSIGFYGDDGNEDTDPITPQLRAIDAINPMDKCFEDAYNAGVTTVVTGPGSANAIGGSFVAMKTYGKCVDDMVIKNPVAMKFAFGENPKTSYNEKNQAPATRMATAALIRETLYKAKDYLDQKNKYLENPDENDKPEYDFKMESIIPLLTGEIFAKVHAHRTDDIFTAIRIAREFGIRITLEHATEGHLIKEYIKKENLKVNVGPSMCDRSKPELRNLTIDTACVLAGEGISTSVITDHPETPIQYLPLCAFLAAKGKMDEFDMIRMITSCAAINNDIYDRVGSISVGKDADIVILDDEKFSVSNNISLVMINGKIVVENSK